MPCSGTGRRSKTTISPASGSSRRPYCHQRLVDLHHLVAGGGQSSQRQSGRNDDRRDPLADAAALPARAVKRNAAMMRPVVHLDPGTDQLADTFRQPAVADLWCGCFLLSLGRTTA